MNYEIAMTRDQPTDGSVRLELRDTRTGRVVSPTNRQHTFDSASFGRPRGRSKDTLLTCPSAAEITAAAKKVYEQLRMNLGKCWTGSEFPELSRWDEKSRDAVNRLVTVLLARDNAVIEGSNPDDLEGMDKERDGLQYKGACGGYSTVPGTRHAADRAFATPGQRQVYDSRLSAMKLNESLNAAARARWGR